MRNYYIIENGQKKGPLSFEALHSFEIHPNTLIWHEGSEDWKAAQYVPELQAIIIRKTPPIHTYEPPPTPRIQNFSQSFSQEDILDDYDYSQVEDIAGVNYRNGMMVVGGYIALNILIKSFVISTLGIIVSTALVVSSWWYFREYFDAMKDKDTGKFINWVMGAHIVFAIANLFLSTTDWTIEAEISLYDVILSVLGWGSFDYIGGLLFGIKLATYATLFAMATIFIAGVRILWINNRHPFPLKRIAVSGMILIPLGMLIQLGEGVTKMVGTGITFNAILMLPFFFLLHHFYRADTDDLTP